MEIPSTILSSFPPLFCSEISSRKTERVGGGPDALKLPNQALRGSGEEVWQKYVARRCPDGKQHLFFWPLLVNHWLQTVQLLTVGINI
ncbi:hypothetical protein TNCV_4696361 [Trichonephila clavipes]|nr:hypothetical protein TNCV_4696361 [Trichonephila clavipes]